MEYYTMDRNIKKTEFYMSKNIQVSFKQGQTMLFSVIFFVFLSIIVVAGLVSPVAREYKITTLNNQSKQTYYLSESGAEDVLYRLLKNIEVDDTEILNISNGEVVTNASRVDGVMHISSFGDKDSINREIDLTLDEGYIASFDYSLQTGTGGFDITGGSNVIGSIFANGPITGDSSSAITGSAVSANSPDFGLNQSNGTGTPTYDVIFGKTSASQDAAQSFSVSTDTTLNQVQFYIKKISTPGNITVRLVNNSNGVPGTTTIANATLTSVSVTGSYAWATVSFGTNPALTAGTTYWLVLDASVSNTKYYMVGGNAGGYASGVGKIGQYSGVWADTNPAGIDYFFRVYTGGASGSIRGESQWNQLHIGTVSGNAAAHIANYVNVTGTLTCQEGTGNNKSCSPGTDPTYADMPIEDAMIDAWKNDAELGGVYNGNYSVGWAGATLGPKKINGNLTVSGGGILTVTGTLWVTGNIDLSGGGLMKLSVDYGEDDGVVVAGGNISVSGGADATGSGEDGSYILLLSESTSGSAASISGGSGAVVLYAANGTLTISGGADLKGGTAKRIVVSGGSDVTYESGLADMHFASGNEAGFSIGKWKETQ